MDDNDIAFRHWSRIFAVAAFTSRIVIDFLPAAARGRRAVVMRHLFGGGREIDLGGDEWFGDSDRGRIDS